MKCIKCGRPTANNQKYCKFCLDKFKKLKKILDSK